MSSKAQKRFGYPLPADEFTEETQSYCVTIPAGDEYYQAFAAQLSELGKWWFWKRDENRPRAASDAAMTWRLLHTINENCGGDFNMTPEELENAIANGNYKAFNWLALQIASGTYSNLNIVTDESGVVTLPPSGDAGGEIPEDDPTTDFDESQAAQMGGTISFLRGIELLLDKVDNYYGVTNGTPTTILLDCQYAITSYFPCDSAAMDTALFNYYSYRNSNPRILFDLVASIQNYVFCKGRDIRAFKRWMVDLSAYAQAKQNVINGMLDALTEEFYTSYYGEGISKPSTLYLDAPCIPIAPQTLLNMLFAVTRTTTPFKSQHRMRFQAKGYAVDADGDVQDWFWFRTAAGVLTRSNATFVHSSGNNLPSDNQVVYNAAHVYDYTIDLGALNQVMNITPNKNAAMNAVGLTYPVPFELTITDLGEYAV